MPNWLQCCITSKPFRVILTVLSILFVILTYFISVTPDSFLKFGYLGVFAFNVVSSGLLIIPIIIEKMNLALIVLVSALGNIFNTSINYVLGASSSSLFTNVSIVNKMKGLVNKYGLPAVFVLAIIPFPIDINALLSGYMGIPYKKYIAVNFLGKVVIFTLAGLGVITFAQAIQ